MTSSIRFLELEWFRQTDEIKERSTTSSTRTTTKDIVERDQQQIQVVTNISYLNWNWSWYASLIRIIPPHRLYRRTRFRWRQSTSVGRKQQSISSHSLRIWIIRSIRTLILKGINQVIVQANVNAFTSTSNQSVTDLLLEGTKSLD